MTPRPVPDSLVDGWQRLLSQWTNKLAHDWILAQAVVHDQLAWLATCYREFAPLGPFDHIARERLDHVHRAAMMLAFPASTFFDAPTERLSHTAR